MTMVFRALLAAILVTGLAQISIAQECLTADPERAREIARMLAEQGGCQVSCSGCGCRGGPGYRGPNGQCVGWADLNRTCGPAPHAKCERECRPVASGCPKPDARTLRPG